MDKLVVTEESFIGSELKKFEIDETALIATANKYKGLKVAGVQDKEGLKAVRMARLELKELRVDITNKGKALRASAVKFQKAVIAREEELVDLIKPTEKELEAEEDRIEAEKKRLREEEEKREFERLKLMDQKLSAVNFAMDFTELKGLTDEQFDNVLKEATAKFKEAEDLRIYEELKEREHKAEVERRRLVEEQRILNLSREQEEREKKLKEEAAALALEKAKIEEDKRKFQEQIESENRKLEEAKRLEQARKEAAEKAVRDEQERARKEAEAKAEAERIEKENALKEESERPDKEKLQKFAQYLMEDIEYPVCSTEKGKQLVSATVEKIQEIATSLYATAKRKRW